MAASKVKLAVGALAAVLAVAAPVITYYEGTVLRGYRDPIGIVTACVGHTATAQLGRTYTRTECDALLAGDMLSYYEAIQPCIRVPVSVNERAAYLSFAFNVGAQAFCTSTVARKLNAHDYAGACAQLSRWTYAGGRQLPGLVKRRAAERELCERGGTREFMP